jgi:hypothetical protein
MPNTTSGATHQKIAAGSRAIRLRYGVISRFRIRQGILDPWRTNLAELAKPYHVNYKIAGMGTEASWEILDEGEPSALSRPCVQFEGEAQRRARSDALTAFAGESRASWFARSRIQLFGNLSMECEFSKP